MKPHDGDDVYCHFSAIEDYDVAPFLLPGSSVQYVKAFDDRGRPMAKQVSACTRAGWARVSDGYATVARQSGIARSWNDKGFGLSFGFIKPDDGGKDLICYSTAIEDATCLVPSFKVTYIKKCSDKGKMNAELVRDGEPDQTRFVHVLA